MKRILVAIFIIITISAYSHASDVCSTRTCPASGEETCTDDQWENACAGDPSDTKCYYLYDDVESVCQACPPGYSCSNGKQSEGSCSSNTFAPEGAGVCYTKPTNGSANSTGGDGTTIYDDFTCNAGYYYNENNRGSDDSGVDYYINVCVACTGKTYSSAGKPTSCTPCTGDTYAVDEDHTKCTLCENNQVPNDNGIGCKNCGTNQVAQDGKCVCKAGYYLSGGTCTACGMGTYKDKDSNDTSCTQCGGSGATLTDGVSSDGRTTTNTGSDSLDDCICAKGWYGNAATSAAPGCTECEAGTYKGSAGNISGQNNKCQSCSAGTASWTGASECDNGPTLKIQLYPKLKEDLTVGVPAQNPLISYSDGDKYLEVKVNPKKLNDSDDGYNWDLSGVFVDGIANAQSDDIKDVVQFKVKNNSDFKNEYFKYHTESGNAKTSPVSVIRNLDVYPVSEGVSVWDGSSMKSYQDCTNYLKALKNADNDATVFGDGDDVPDSVTMDANNARYLYGCQFLNAANADSESKKMVTGLNYDSNGNWVLTESSGLYCGPGTKPDAVGNDCEETVAGEYNDGWNTVAKQCPNGSTSSAKAETIESCFYDSSVKFYDNKTVGTSNFFQLPAGIKVVFKKWTDVNPSEDTGGGAEGGPNRVPVQGGTTTDGETDQNP